MNIPIGARVTINRLLQIPGLCAGANSETLEVELELLDMITVSEANFGDLAAEADAALQTVKSAIGALLEAALRKEGRRP